MIDPSMVSENEEDLDIDWNSLMEEIETLDETVENDRDEILMNMLINSNSTFAEFFEHCRTVGREGSESEDK